MQTKNPAEPGERMGSASRLYSVFRVFLRTGSTTYGGMWAATQRLEKDLVHRAGWLTPPELRLSMMLTTVVPAPRFLALSGLVGFRVGGWPGSLSASVGLVLPSSVLVLLGALFMRPELLSGPLVPLTRAISVTVVGVLFGNAYHQLRSSKGTWQKQTTGAGLSVLVFGSVVAGVPLLVAAFGGFVLGVLLLRPEPPSESANEGAR